MKRLIIIGAVVFTAGCATHQEHWGKKAYSVKDLKGEYYYNLAEVRQESGSPIDYCDQHGIATFDGAGNGTSKGTRKCSASGNVTETGNFTYTVSSDGVVLITNVGEPLPTRGQIVNNRRMILIDGTTREPFIFIQHGVAAKK